MFRRTLLSRRGFLKGSAVLAAACAAPTIVPASAFGQEDKPAPSERITVGMIGVGRQARAYNVPQFLTMPDVQITDVCDVDAWRLENAKRQVEEAYAKQQSLGDYRGCRACVDFHDILGRNDVDAVMISAPDHWHVPMALEALEAGKDVSLEKPITRCIDEGRALADMVAARNRVFRVDSEFRSLKHVHHAAQLVRNGRLGRIHTVTVVLPKDDLLCGPQSDMSAPPELDYQRWQGPAPKAPYTENRVHPPRGYDRPGWMRHLYYTDGMITNWGAHLYDGAAWCLGLERTGPIEIEGTGAYPPEDNFWNALWTFDVTMRFADGLCWTYRSGQNDTFDPFCKIEGDNGWISMSFRGVEAQPAALLDENIGPNETHFRLKSDKRDFIDCVKTRDEPLEPAEVGHRITSLGLLGHIAIQMGEILRWDPEKERFVDNDAANEFLNKPIHRPRHT